MSDTVWIAIAGIVGTGLSGIGVALLSAYFNGRNTKMQLDARREELGNEIKHQQGEARRDRIIEARKTYLYPLRERLVSVSAVLLSFQSAVAQFRVGSETQAPPETLAQLKSNVLTWQQRARELADDTMSFTTQLSDATLQSLFNDYWESEHAMSGQLVSLMTAQVSTDGTIPEYNEWEPLLTKARVQREEKLLALNKRIEQLLSGDTTL